MLSKNNYQEKLRKMQPRKNRYSIRKFTVGAASVLIGFFLAGFSQNQTVKADTNSHTDDEMTPHKAQAVNSKDLTTGVEGKNVNVQEVNNEKLAQAANDNKVAKTEKEHILDTLPTQESKSTVNRSKENKDVLTKQVGANLVANKKDNPAKVALAKLAAESKEAQQQNLRGTQTAEASDWQSLVNALNNANNGTINLTGDITVANKGANVNGINRPNPVVNSGKMNLTGENISGGLVINGQGHAINFGANYLSFTTNNQKDSNPWDITFKNMTINADGYDNSWSTLGGAFSPIYMGGDDIRTDLLANNKVTFENVTADIKNGAFYNTTMAQQTTDNPYTTVTFKGNNNITCEAVNVKGNQLYNYSSAVSASHIIFVDGSDTTFNVSSAKTNNDQNAGGNILRAKVEDEANDTAPAIDVQQGATVTLNGNSTDVKGMLVNRAITGTVQVDGNLNANMADGHSMAIWAGNLNIGKTGVVNIKTKQSNDGSGINGVGNYNGYHFAPISLGVGFAANVSNAASNVLDNQGKLTIVRTGVNNQSTSPLISFGSGNGTGAEFSLNVADGATMDLQDGATSSIKGDFTNTPNIGIVTMWGNGGTSGSAASTYANININNPAYVNFQRTGSQTGTLLRLENMNNHVNISSNGGALPLALWDEANKSAGPSYYWYINQLKNQNNWGNNSISGFAQTGNSIGQNKKGEIKFLHSNGDITFAGSQAGLNTFQYQDGVVTQGQPAKGVKYETPYLNRFLNVFNWWTPQRVAMGTNLASIAKPTDAQKYQPQTQVITGYTDQTLNDLTAANGISGYINENGQPATLTGTTVAWYNPATDAAAWTEAMGDQPTPTNPTGKLKVTDGSAWAKVTYQDGTVDFANIPLDIKSQAEEYNPLGQNVNTIVGSEPSAKDGISNTSDLPTSAQYSWSTTPDVSKAGIVPSIVNVTYDDGSMDEVPVNVIVKDSKGNIPDKAGDAAENDPQGKEVSTVIGKLPDPNTAVDWPKNPVDADGKPIDPTQIKYDWSTTPDIWTQGNHPGVVKVTYPDGTNDLVPTTVIVTNSPTGKSTTIEQGGDVPDPSTVIDWTNNGQAPNGTKPNDPKVTYTWVDKPTTTNPGQQTGTVKITYPNGESTVVRVPVTVTATNSSYDPFAKHLVLPYSPTGDGVPEAGSVIELPNGETAPAGVQYTWGTKPDTTKPGMQTANIIATWTTDGKTNTKNIPVTVTVGSMAGYYNPKANDLTVPYNADMNKYPAKNQITGLPSGLKTDDVWAPMPVTSVAGTQPTMIKVTYSDGSFDYVPLNVTVENTAYTPSYNPVSVKPGQQVTDNIVIPDGQKTPSGTKFTAGETTPNWATVDPTTGTITLKPSADVTPGHYFVPVIIAVPGKGNQTITAPVTVIGMDPEHNTYYGSQSMTSFDIPTISVHRTTDSNPINADLAKIQTITYYQDWDGKGNATSNYKTFTTYQLEGNKYVNIKDPSDSFAANVFNYSWMPAGNGVLTPNTNWKVTADNTDTIKYDMGQAPNSLEQTTDGESLPGNSKWRVEYSFNDPDLFGYIGLSSQSSWMNTYFDFYGATTGQALTFNQNQDISNLTQDQYRQLIDVTDLGQAGWNGQNINPNAPQVLAYVPGTDAAKTFSMTWAPNGQPSTKDIANGVSGTVRIHFNDGTYLDVKANINVVADSDSGKGDHNKTEFTQKIVYTYNGHEVAYTTIDNIAKGSSLTAAQLKSAIDGNVPANYNSATGYTYPGAVNDITATPAVINVPLALKNGSQFNAQGQIVYQTADGTQVGTGATIKSNIGDTLTAGLLHDLADQSVPAGYTISQYPGSFEVSTKSFTIPVIVTKATPDTQNFAQNIVYKDAEGKVISTFNKAITGTFTSKTPATVSADEIKNTINNGVPKNWKIATSYKYPAAETISTKTPADIIVLVEHATKYITPTDPGVDPTDPKYKNMFETVTRKIYQTKPGENQTLFDTQSVDFGRKGVEDLVTRDVTGTGDWQVGKISDHKFTLGGSAEFAEENAPQIDGYDSYVDGTKSTQVSSAPALKDGQPVNGQPAYITYLKAGKTTPVPYDPSNREMNKYVTRTINVYKPGLSKAETITQTVHFVRGGVGQNAGMKDTEGNIAWTPWTVADGDNVSTGAETGTWKEYDVDQINNYTSTVDGKDATKVDAKAVNADTSNVTVTVAYTQTLQPTDPTINPNKPGENSDMYAHPTRTINVKNPVTGNTDTSTQVVWFGRTKTVSTDPNVKPTYGKWQLGKVENDKFVIDSTAKAEWPEFAAPTFDGYTPSQDKVTAVNDIKPDTVNVIVTITYSKNNNGGGNVTPTPQGQVTIIYRDSNGTEVGRTTISGAEGSTVDPSSTIEGNIPSGYKLKDGYQVPTNASISSTIEVPVVVADNGGNNGNDDNGNKGPTVPTDSNNHNNGHDNEFNNGNKANSAADNGGITENDNTYSAHTTGNNIQHGISAKKLPQTGNKTNKWGIFGLAVASLAALFGLGSDKKRRSR